MPSRRILKSKRLLICNGLVIVAKQKSVNIEGYSGVIATSKIDLSI